MPPSHTRTVKSKHAASKSGIKNSKAAANSASSGGISKSKAKKQQQSKGVSSKQTSLASKSAASRKKKRIYTAEELGVPKLNMITPVGVVKPSGKDGGKKGKVFVDDSESMLTIMAMVRADKEGQIESKMQKARQMEEIREARKAEAEKRKGLKKEKLEEAKEGLRKKRKRGSASGGGDDGEGAAHNSARPGTTSLKLKKKVSFKKAA